MLRKLLTIFTIASACALQGSAGQAPVYTLIYSPPQGALVGYPSSILEGLPGLFYIMGARETNTFGATAFSLNTAGVLTSIYAMAPSTSSYTLVQGTDGFLYGGAWVPVGHSVSNFYFSVSTSGNNFKQYPLPGTYPNQWGTANQILITPPGELYDIVGMMVGNSTVWAFAGLSQPGKVSILHQFTGTDGAPTGGNIAYGPDGNIYGIGNQQYGGINPGFIFRFTPTGSYSQLLTFPQAFPSTGYIPPLIAASDGNLYTVFSTGGTNNTGQLYRATLSGQLQSVANFPVNGIARPLTLMQAADGNLYGSTNSDSIFKYDMKTHQLSGVIQFSRAAPGTPVCPCPLIEGMDGQLYGVSAVGGNSPGNGAVFSLNIGLPKPLPAIAAMFPSSGAAGQPVILWGNHLLGATAVSFNGTPASTVLVTSTQSVQVTVPAGATTGPVTITTANGSFTTKKSFTVK